MKFEDTIGKTFKFYGVYNECFKLDNLVFEAIKDPADGYRSYLDAVLVTYDDELILFNRSIAVVQVVDVTDTLFDGYELVDVEDGHVWLRFGTDDTDDYYPCFIFDYTPKESSWQEH